MLKVMIVDNEAIIRHGLAQCIDWNALGCTIAGQAADGLSALELLPTVQPDIIISDIRMPGMDGIELARQVYEQYPQIKVIILTGFPDFEYAQKAIAYRVVDFVLKPTSTDQLTTAVEKAKAQILEEENRRQLCRSLEDQSERNLDLQRGILLRDMIQNERLSQLFIYNSLTQLQIQLDRYYVLLVVVDLEGTPETEIDYTPYMAETRGILEKCMPECRLYYVPNGDQVCYVIVRTPDERGIVGACREAAGIVYNLTPVEMRVGISRRHSAPLELYAAAREAETAQRYADYSVKQPVVSVEDMPHISPETLQRVTEELKLLKSAIENYNAARTEEIFHELFQYIRETRLPFGEMRSICIYIYEFCVGMLFQCNPAECMTGVRLLSVDQLLRERDLEGIERSLLRFMEDTLSHIDHNTENVDALVLTVKNYIDQHYAEDLSLELLAGIVHLSPSYLSKLFKREIGENISIYQQNVRIEQAKLLLRTTNLRTYEVAEAVGLSNPVYFSRIFKRVTGLKPKDYKNGLEP